MGDYEEYIDRLKASGPGFDDQKMSSRIKAGITGRARHARLALGGALVLLLIGSVIYFNVLPHFFGNGVTLADYVFRQNEMNGDQILNYIFMD
ncbi:hypothetical protein HZC35_03955 [Candidatus Saganbacteria bacterium]|nr:hypothetical protein [Candidatus Saganbacteria bacterium]